MDSLELIALLFVVIVTAVAWVGTWRRSDPPADEHEKERKTLSVDLRDRD